MKFKINSAKNLSFNHYDNWTEVELKPCFPISSPQKIFSILNSEGQELEIIDDINSLESKDKEVIEEYFTFRQFHFIVKGIYSIEDNFGIRQYEVLTQVGKRIFQTELDAWPKKYKDKIIVTDIYGDQYWIKSLDFGDKFLKSII